MGKKKYGTKPGRSGFFKKVNLLTPHSRKQKRRLKAAEEEKKKQGYFVKVVLSKPKK